MKLFVVVCFCFGAGGGQSALELGVKLFAVVVAVCFCFGAGGGPVSFGVGCETVRRRRRRLFLFWGGRGASQLWSLVVSSSVFFRGGRGGESASGVRSNGLCPQSVFAAGGLVPVGFKHSWLSTSHYLLEKHKLCDCDSLRVRGARAPARRRERG